MAMQILCILCLAGSTLYFMIGWNQIPAEVPGHYNFAGEVDSMTGKGSLIFLIVLNWVMYLGMSVLEHFPQARNRTRVYRILYHMLVCLKFSVVLIFSFITSWHENYMPPWFLAATLLLTFGPMIFFLVQLWRVR